MTDKPLFSIIVVSYNASTLIRDTINSILKQTYDDYEIVVKDACSKDDTIEQIPDSDKIRLFQSNDTGIYDGMNQAIKVANGKFLHFLNCGDVFSDENVLQKVAIYIKKNNINNGIVYGNSMMSNGIRKQPSVIRAFFLFRTPLCHQSMFFAKSVFDDYGLYNLEYKIASDYDCTLKAFRNGVQFSYINITICDYLGGGVSESEKGVQLKKQEYKQIHKEYYSGGERFLFNVILLLSLKKIRYWMNSKKSPKFVQNLYHLVVNKINK